MCFSAGQSPGQSRRRCTRTPLPRCRRAPTRSPRASAAASTGWPSNRECRICINEPTVPTLNFFISRSFHYPRVKRNSPVRPPFLIYWMPTRSQINNMLNLLTNIRCALPYRVYGLTAKYSWNVIFHRYCLRAFIINLTYKVTHWNLLCKNLKSRRLSSTSGLCFKMMLHKFTWYSKLYQISIVYKYILFLSEAFEINHVFFV